MTTLGVRVRSSGKPDAGAPCRPGRAHICRRIADEDRIGNRDPCAGGSPQEQAGQQLPAVAGTGLVRADVHRVDPGTVLGEQLGEAAMHRGDIVHGAPPARHAPLLVTTSTGRPASFNRRTASADRAAVAAARGG